LLFVGHPSRKDEAMDREKDWKVLQLEEDALLFALQPDGSMKMCAVPIREWRSRLAETGVAESGRAVADLVRRIVGVESAAMADLSSSMRATSR
jgi:hypothetical protein